MLIRLSICFLVMPAAFVIISPFTAKVVAFDDVGNHDDEDDEDDAAAAAKIGSFFVSPLTVASRFLSSIDVFGVSSLSVWTPPSSWSFSSTVVAHCSTSGCVAVASSLLRYVNLPNE